MYLNMKNSIKIGTNENNDQFHQLLPNIKLAECEYKTFWKHTYVWQFLWILLILVEMIALVSQTLIYVGI